MTIQATSAPRRDGARFVALPRCRCGRLAQWMDIELDRATCSFCAMAIEARVAFEVAE